MDTPCFLLWDELLAEMQGEVSIRLDPGTRQALCQTNKRYHERWYNVQLKWIEKKPPNEQQKEFWKESLLFYLEDLFKYIPDRKTLSMYIECFVWNRHETIIQTLVLSQVHVPIQEAWETTLFAFILTNRLDDFRSWTPEKDIKFCYHTYAAKVGNVEFLLRYPPPREVNQHLMFDLCCTPHPVDWPLLFANENWSHTLNVLLSSVFMHALYKANDKNVEREAWRRLWPYCSSVKKLLASRQYRQRFNESLFEDEIDIAPTFFHL